MDLGTRMKSNYEVRSRSYLTCRTNTIIRLDGVSFGNYTSNLEKPFDEGFIEDMILTTEYLCKEIQGVKTGYVQSDEISLLLTDYDDLDTQQWHKGQIQKIVSNSAGKASAYFTKLRVLRCIKEGKKVEDLKIGSFDSRVFQIPEKEEVVNYFLWRQRDAVKNSISMLAQSLYSTNELKGKNSDERQELCFQKGHNWNDLHCYKKRGALITKYALINSDIKLVYKTPWGNYFKTKESSEEPTLGDYIYSPKDKQNPERLLCFKDKSETSHGNFDDYVEVSIEFKRFKWGRLEETPHISKDRTFILNLMPKQN